MIRFHRHGGAVFDSTGQYRYLLQRDWLPRDARITFIMLNPSTADATTDDATIRRCRSFAKFWGYSGLNVVNLFAYRSTHPKVLQTVVDPVGVDCDRYLLAAAQAATTLVLAWGNYGSLYHRDRAVLKLLAPYSPLYCLGQTRQNQPIHPLYRRLTTPLKIYSSRLL